MPKASEPLKKLPKKPSLKSLTMRNKTHIGLAVLALIVLFAGSALYVRSNQLRTPELPEPSLNELAAERGIMLGNHAILNRIDEKPYADILTTQFDFVLADNTPNWYFNGNTGLRPSENEFNWQQMDQVMSFAEKHNMPVESHHYVWGEEKWLPDWLKEGNYSEQELMDLMREHILIVGNRYSGRIMQWSVVNEAFTRAEGLYGLNDWWADNTGGNLDYIDQAFIWARQADPHSKLILNDFQNESINEISDAMYDYVKGALERDVPIDGIGMQMHIDGVHPPTKKEVVDNMNRFADLGVEVYVTEFDVNMNDVKAEPDDKDKIQENIYYEMMRACIEAKACNHFAFLGITDRETWYNHIGLPDPRPLMFDRNYQPKPAFWGVRTALQQED